MTQRRLIGFEAVSMADLLLVIKTYIAELEKEFSVTSVQVSPYKDGRKHCAVVVVELEW